MDGIKCLSKPLSCTECVCAFVKIRRVVQSSVFSSLLVGLLLSVNTVLVKNDPGIPPMQFIAVSALGSWLLCIAIGSSIKKWGSKSSYTMFGNVSDMPRLALIGVFYSVSTILLYFAINLVLVSDALLLYYLYPLISTMFGVLLLKVECGYQTAFGGLICILGALCVAVPWTNLVADINLWKAWEFEKRIGMGFSLLSAVASAIAYLLSGARWDSRTPSKFSHPIAISIWSFQLQVCGSLLFILLGWSEKWIPLRDLKNECWLWLMFFTLSSTAGRLLSSWVTKNKTKSFVIVLEATHILWASVGAYLTVGETPTLFVLMGGVTTIMGISFLSLQAQHLDDDMEDWNLEDDPVSEGVLQTASTMFTVDINAWA